MQFQGIDISTHGMIGQLIACGIPLLLCIASVVVIILLLCDRDELSRTKKTKERIEKLKQRAKNDEYAAKELERVLRKQKKRRKKNKKWQLYALLAIIACIIISDVFLGIIPICQDMYYSDYVVYEGEFSVRYVSGFRYSQRYHTYIGDESEQLLGGIKYVDGIGEYSGRVVYSRRSKVVVAIVDEAPINR